MKVTNTNWPHTQGVTCTNASCKAAITLEEGDVRCTVLAAPTSTISGSFKCPVCGAALTISSTKALVTQMNIPVALQKPPVKALLAGTAYSENAPTVVSSKT